MTGRLVDDETTMADLMSWHQADRPECGSRWVVMTATGFGCERCGWHVDTDDNASETTT